MAARVLDRKYEVHGKDINANVTLDSDIYNPVYETKTEFRENNIPPSATILFKVKDIRNTRWNGQLEIGCGGNWILLNDLWQ